MAGKKARAEVTPVRQQNQYNCMTTSLCMALRALGVPDEECSVQQVNKVVGAMPLRGAAWEPLLAAANHYGMRATLTLPSTVRQLKKWTDAGNPVVIAWNPEGREWSHASLVFDVTEDDEHGFLVHVADPNIPDPDETVRVVPKKEFYAKWYEKAPQGFLIRRPACAIEREITPEGRQMMASAGRSNWDRVFDTLSSKKVTDSRGKPLGVLFIDRGKVNWRPNILQGDHLPPPQVILRGSHTTPMDDLESFADNWVKRNIKMGSERNAYEVYVDENGMAHDDEGNTWRAGPGYGQGTYGLHNAPGLPRRRRPAPSVVDQKKLQALDSLLVKRPGDKFLRSIRDQVARGKRLSDKQLKAVRQNFYRNRMKPLADHFRSATSAKRVLARWVRTSKTAAELKDIWVVTEPAEWDEIVGIVSQISDPRTLGDLIRGMGRRWDTDLPALHDSQDSAEKDAMRRLEKVHRGDVPDWVLQDKGNYKLASVRRLVQAYTKQSNRFQKRMDRKLKSLINRSFERIGLDGNTRFNTPQQGYSRAVDLMGEYGVELAEVPDSFDFKHRPTGTVRVDVAFTNQEDIFSPYEITNSMLVVQYTELREDVFEVIAYMS